MVPSSLSHLGLIVNFPFHLSLNEIKVNPSYLALMQLSGTRCHLLKRKKRAETNGDENLLLSGNYLFWEQGQQKTNICFAHLGNFELESDLAFG